MFNPLAIVGLCCCAVLVGSCEVRAAQPVPSGYRRALLIGNAKYQGFTLPGVSAGLDTVEKAFAARGYKVTRAEDLDETGLKETVRQFAQKMPTGGVAVVYFAGLGAHQERSSSVYNMLLPVKAKLESDSDFRSKGLRVSDMLQWLGDSSGAKNTLVFLDACWQSPVKATKGEMFPGLMEFTPSRRQPVFAAGDPPLVLFAAASKETFAPGDGPSRMAKAVASRVADFDTNVRTAGETIAKELNGSWLYGGSEAGLGLRPSAEPIQSLREGKSPGEGFVNSVGMSFRWCPAGQFEMGSKNIEAADTRDRELVSVTLTKGFWLGEHEVTQREYYAVMKKTVGVGFSRKKNSPFWGVTESKQIAEFCHKLTDLDRKAGKLPSGWAYVAPSEAQWEYACRAGSKSAFCFGDDPKQLGSYGNVADRTLHATNPNYYWSETRTDDGIAEALADVGSYLPNAWGLRDMHGNVAEMVADSHQETLPGGKDPLIRVEKDAVPVLRGGAWCSQSRYCESSFRNVAGGRDKLNYVGFRIALMRVK